MSEKYNGYTNYETWLVGANLDNEEYHYNAIMTAAKGILSAADTTDPDDLQRAVVALSEWMRKYVTPTEPVQGDAFPRLYTDLLIAAVGRVNFLELAADRIDEIDPDLRIWALQN